MDGVGERGPCRRVVVGPQPRRPGGDPPARHRRHRFGDHQPGTRPGRGDEDLVAGPRDTLDGIIGRIGDDHDPVGHRLGGPAEAQGREDGRRCGQAAGVTGENPVDLVDQSGIAAGQLQVRDAAAAGEEVEGELLGGQVEVAADRLEVARRVGGHLLEPLHHRLTLAFVGGEGPLGMVGFGHERLVQGDGVVEGEPGARADGEVRGVGGVAEEDDVDPTRRRAVPGAVPQGGEGVPHRAAGVGLEEEAAPVQPRREQLLAEGYGLLVAHGVETGSPPGRLGRLDDEGRAGGVERVGVHLEQPGRGGLEDEREHGQDEVGAEPHVPRRVGPFRGAEAIGKGGADGGTDAVGADHEVAPLGRRGRVERVFVADVGADGGGPGGEDTEQFGAGDGGEGVPGRAGAAAGVVDVDGAPPDQRLVDGQVGLVVGVAQLRQRLRREDDAPAVRGPRPVPLVDGDPVVPRPAEQDGQVQARRPASADVDVHETVAMIASSSASSEVPGRSTSSSQPASA
jgi:hypothetical protein